MLESKGRRMVLARGEDIPPVWRQVRLNDAVTSVRKAVGAEPAAAKGMKKHFHGRYSEQSFSFIFPQPALAGR